MKKTKSIIFVILAVSLLAMIPASITQAKTKNTKVEVTKYVFSCNDTHEAYDVNVVKCYVQGSQIDCYNTVTYKLDNGEIITFAHGMAIWEHNDKSIDTYLTASIRKVK